MCDEAALSGARFCGSCGAELEVNVTECRQCGKTVCINCGNVLQSTDNICPVCGQPVVG